MVDSLAKIGVLPRKSLTVGFPSRDVITDDLFWPFVRGYFDGDGCICTSSNHRNHVTVQMCVSRKFGKELQRRLAQMSGLKASFVKTQNKIHKLSISGFRQSLFFLGRLYDSTDICMLRRKNKYIELKERRILDGFSIPDIKVLSETVSNLTRDPKTGRYVGLSQSSA